MDLEALSAGIVLKLGCHVIQVGDRGFLDIVVVKRFTKLCRSRDFLIALLKTSGSRIQSKALFPRLGLNDVGALATKSFVLPQDTAYFGRAPPFKEDRESDAIFDRLIGALSEVGKHRVCCVA
jgi:hypothetical protein